jgi:hypothetical protein
MSRNNFGEGLVKTMKKILLTHPNLIDIVDKVQEKCSPTIITGSTDFKEVLALVQAKQVERLSIVFEVTGIQTLDLIKRVYAIDPLLPILAWDCSGLNFEDLGDNPEVLEDHIFFINSSEFKKDPFFECFDKFFSGLLIPYDFQELETI